MTAALAVAGWLLVAALLVHHRRHLELAARARHEIAGPLHAAGLALHVARRETPSPRLAAVELELRRAARALDDLEAARDGRVAGDCTQTVDVGCLLAEQALAWQVAARDRGRTLRIAASSGLTVTADPVRLAQAVGNLLANAIEHGTGRIELRAAAEAGRVTIEVADEGTGPPATIRRPRAGRRARGRGLAISADIAARHGGTLATHGARVAIELPAATRR